MYLGIGMGFLAILIVRLVVRVSCALGIASMGGFICCLRIGSAVLITGRYGLIN